jgi:hypothetical protein
MHPLNFSTCLRFSASQVIANLLISITVFFMSTGSTHAQTQESAGSNSYSYFYVGNPEAAVSVSNVRPNASYVLMGGGPDVDAAFRWMITRAGIQPGTGGRFLIIRATGTEAYNPYIFYSDESLSTSGTIADQCEARCIFRIKLG